MKLQENKFKKDKFEDSTFSYKDQPLGIKAVSGQL